MAADNPQSQGQLLLPALRGQMGDWVYYTALLRLKDVVPRISLAEEIHESKSLNDLIQRALTSNSRRIARYLLTQPQRMMSALVIGVYGGEPRWYELAVRQNIHLEPQGIQEVEMKLGVLQLMGTEQLFAIDGQHRVIGIREAVSERPSLGEEEVSIIFVAHDRTAEGRRRTRRLFTTLNRYAKPVSATEKIALDEDDVVAVVTRRLLDEHPVLYEKVSTARAVNIAARDRRSLTSLPALYQSVDVVLRDMPARAWADFKRLRPSEEDIERRYRLAAQFFSLLQSEFPPIARLAESSPKGEVAGEYRSEDGGHLLFRPVGLIAMARAFDALVRAGWQRRTAIRRLARVPMQLNAVPWAGVIWDSALHRMITNKEVQSLAVALLIYGAGGSEREIGRSAESVRRELAAVLQRPVGEIELGRYSRARSARRARLHQ
jgi:DNA sulfur modification protein DndB